MEWKISSKDLMITNEVIHRFPKNLMTLQQTLKVLRDGLSSSYNWEEEYRNKPKKMAQMKQRYEVGDKNEERLIQAFNALIYSKFHGYAALPTQRKSISDHNGVDIILIMPGVGGTLIQVKSSVSGIKRAQESINEVKFKDFITLVKVNDNVSQELLTQEMRRFLESLRWIYPKPKEDSEILLKLKRPIKNPWNLVSKTKSSC